jgi:hypothetical protein
LSTNQVAVRQIALRKPRAVFVEQRAFPVCAVAIQDHVGEIPPNESVIDLTIKNLVGFMRLFGQFVAAGADDQLRRPCGSD